MNRLEKIQKHTEFVLEEEKAKAEAKAKAITLFLDKVSERKERTKELIALGNAIMENYAKLNDNSYNNFYKKFKADGFAHTFGFFINSKGVYGIGIDYYTDDEIVLKDEGVKISDVILERDWNSDFYRIKYTEEFFELYDEFEKTLFEYIDNLQTA